MVEVGLNGQMTSACGRCAILETAAAPLLYSALLTSPPCRLVDCTLFSFLRPFPPLIGLSRCDYIHRFAADVAQHLTCLHSTAA